MILNLYEETCLKLDFKYVILVGVGGFLSVLFSGISGQAVFRAGAKDNTLTKYIRVLKAAYKVPKD